MSLASSTRYREEVRVSRRREYLTMLDGPEVQSKLARPSFSAAWRSPKWAARSLFRARERDIDNISACLVAGLSI